MDRVRYSFGLTFRVMLRSVSAEFPVITAQASGELWVKKAAALAVEGWGLIFLALPQTVSQPPLCTTGLPDS